MARKPITTRRRDRGRRLARAREDQLAASEFVGKGLHDVAARDTRARRPPSTGLFVSTDAKLGDEAEILRGLAP